MDKFSDRLRELRLEREMRQSDVGKVVGVSTSTASGYECEGKEPSFLTLSKLAAYFGVTTDYLLGLSDEREGRAVFFADNINFEEHLQMIPASDRAVVSRCFREFYLLLDSDVQLDCRDRLLAYVKLLHSLQSGRVAVRAAVASSGSASAEVLSAQSKLRAEVDSTLDELLQADLEQVAPPAQKSSGATAG